MRVAFLTLGCKVNYCETEKMMTQFRERGFEIVDLEGGADICIVNTCTVTNVADRKSRKLLHRARKKNPGAVVAAVGCYAQSGGGELRGDGAVDLILTNRDKERIADRVIAYMEETGRLEARREDVPKCTASEPGCEGGNDVPNGRTRKYIKVQDGCNQFCSYCLIPYVRGGGELSSRGEADVLEEVRRAADRGYKEVVLTGIHLSSYGVDSSDARRFVELKGAPLAALLQRASQVSGIERIRLGSLEPRIICGEFLEGLAGVDKLCPHFHLSLQSGCDATLRRMNRHYTAAQYRESCERIRRYFDDPAITTDVIVGFPGETEGEFEETRRFVREVSLAAIHVFPYSVRSGTRAAQMSGHVPPEEKHRRSELLIGDASALQYDYARRFVGRTERVLFEEVREAGGEKFLVGHNERYVLFGVPLSEARARGYAENKLCTVEVGEKNLFGIHRK